MKLGIEVGLSPGDFVLDGDTAPQFLAHVCCGQTAGCIRIPLGTEVGLGQGNIVLDGAQIPPQKGHAPSFQPMSIAAKQSPITATAELLYGHYTGKPAPPVKNCRIL